MAVNDYYFALQNLSNSDKIFGYYSGSAIFDYRFDYLTQSAQPGAGDIRLNAGTLYTSSNANEIAASQIYIDEDDISNRESVIGYLTRLDDLSPKGQIKLAVSGSSSFNVTYNITTIETGSNLTYMIVNVTGGSGNVGSGDVNNPISQSYAYTTSSRTTKKPIIVTFLGSDLRGYHEIDVTGSSTKYIVAESGSFGSPATGSIPAPFNIDWGVPESTFTLDSYYPSNSGFAWLWNDGYKVKHIKMNNVSSTGAILTDFIKASQWARFVMFDPVNSTGSLIHNGNGFYAEDYQLLNVTKYSNQGYSHLFVDQTNNETSFAVDVSNQTNVIDTFDVTGDYIVYATSSGTSLEPTRSIGVDSSIPQGYFPSSSTNYPTEQFFRGWAGAKYYVNGNLISTNGTLDDPLQSFNSGSTEKDNDGAASYIPSSLPFFIDATASYIEVLSSSFVEYASQTNLTQIGPGFLTSGGDELIYYYKENTGQIIIKGSQYLNTPKSTNLDFDPRFDVQLVNANESPTTYNTLEGFNIEVKESQSLWLTRGLASVGTGDGNLWKYNNHFHRPFKTYIVTSTGSIEGGYGLEFYGTSSYGIDDGGTPVGPPPNEFESVYISYSSSKASDRPEDGLYTFDQNLIEPLYITASAQLGFTSIDVVRSSSYGTASYGEDEFEYGGTGSGDEVLTWQTANLKLYQNNTLIATETTSINSSNILYGLTSTLTTTLQPNQVSIGDTLKLSLEVENEDSNFNSSLIVNSYTMSFDNLVYPSNNLTPVTFNNYLELNDDCNPIINNIAGDRPNQRLQDVDYSVDILSPINFEQILKNEAVRATVPESNYTQLGFANQRYFGSSTTREEINEFRPFSPIDTKNKIWYENNPLLSSMGDGPSLGKIPNVELKNAYVAYFNKIIDPYPTLNGKTAYYVRYLIDENGTVFDPTLSDINYSIFEGTFQSQDYDSKPTRVKASLQTISEAKELSQLNKGLANTFEVGKYPVPILLTQTSSLGHVSSIPLSGSKFYTSLGPGATFSNFGYSASAEFQGTGWDPAASKKDSSTFTNVLSDYTGVGTDIGLFEPVDGISSYDQNGEFQFPLDAASTQPNTDGAILCDNYQLNGTYKFYTTSVPWSTRTLTMLRENDASDNAWMHFMDFNFDVYQTSSIISGYQKTSTDFDISSMTLNIYVDAETSSPTIYTVNIPTGTQRSSANGTTSGLTKTTTGANLELNSRWLYRQLLEQNGSTWNTNNRSRTELEIAFGGGWDGVGIGTHAADTPRAVQWEWVLNFTLGSSANYFKQGSGFKFVGNGTMRKFYDSSPGGKVNDPYLQIDNQAKYNRYNELFWYRNFFPQIPGRPDAPVLELQLTSPKAGSFQNQNGALAPYWRRYSTTTNQLEMQSSTLNQAYAIKNIDGSYNQYYVQAKLPYSGSTNTDFPLTVEPDFIEFDPITDVWSLEEGDEIRFENDENLTFRISSIDGQKAILPPTESPNGKLIVTVSPSFTEVEPANFDFFVVRRYKENRNFIILDQQKPYGFPVSASSSPGILLPEHRIEKYDINPDEVLQELIKNKII